MSRMIYLPAVNLRDAPKQHGKLKTKKKHSTLQDDPMLAVHTFRQKVDVAWEPSHATRGAAEVSKNFLRS